MRAEVVRPLPFTPKWQPDGEPTGASQRRTALLHRPISPQSGTNLPKPPRDLVDFHLRWAEFRPLMVALQGKDGLSGEEANTLGWLIALSDRVSEQDIG